MDELVAFVRAALDEDERVARRANPAPWRTFSDKAHLDPLTIFGGSYMGDQEKLRNVASLELSWVKAGNAEQITRWDPARVLAEVEAKRQRLDWIEGELRDDPTDETAQWLAKVEAQPYAGQPGWREEWRA